MITNTKMIVSLSLWTLFNCLVGYSSAQTSVTGIPDTGGSAQWVKLGTLSAVQAGVSAYVTVVTNEGYNASINQSAEAFIRFETSNGVSVDGNGFAAASSYYTTGLSGLGIGGVKWVSNAAGTAATSFDLYVFLGPFTGASYYFVSTSGTWNPSVVLGLPDPGASGSPTVLIATNQFSIDNAAFSLSATGGVGIGSGGAAAELLQVGSFNNQGNIVSWAGGANVGATSSLKFDMSVAGGYSRSELGSIQSLAYQNGGHNQLLFNVGSWNNKNTSSPVMTLQDNGRVGIGTVAPAATLEVNGGAQIDGNITVQSITFPGGGILSSPTPANLSSVNGNTGIATTNPQSTLDVNGNINYQTLTAGLGTYSNGTPSGYYYVGSLGNFGAGAVQHLEIEVLGGAWGGQGLTRWTCNGYGGAVHCTRLNDSYSPDVNDLAVFLDSNNNFDFYVSTNANNGWESFAVSSKLWDAVNYRTVTPVFTPSPTGTPQTITLTVGPTLTQAGNVGFGTSTPGQTLQYVNSSNTLVPYVSTGPIVEVKGTIALTTGSGASMLYADGTVQSTAWNGTTLGGDYAESVDVIGVRSDYKPGDLIVIDEECEGKFEKSVVAYSHSIAGVYSTKPGLLGRRATAERPDKTDEVPMAMVGIVPTKVTTENGPIHRGDLLVSSSTPGYAMKGTDTLRMIGAIVGKALGELDSGNGLIEVLVTLQ